MSAKRLHAVDAVQPVAAGPRYPIESVDNVLRLLLMISQQKQVRVPEASAALGTAVSTAGAENLVHVMRPGGTR
jgi:hypothetical protein